MNFQNPIWVIISLSLSHSWKVEKDNRKKIHSIILSVTCHSLRNFPSLIHIPHIHSWIFKTLWVIISWVWVIHKMIKSELHRNSLNNFISHLSLRCDPTPPLYDILHPCVSHSTPPLHDPPHPTQHTPPLHDPPHPGMTHPTPAWPTPPLPLHDPPHPCMTHPTSTWPTPPLHDSPHPCMTHHTPAWPTHPTWPTPPVHDSPHPYMTHPTPTWPTPPLHDPPHPTWPTPPLHDPPHPYMTHPTPTWPSSPLHDPPHPTMTHPTPRTFLGRTSLEFMGSITVSLSVDN